MSTCTGAVLAALVAVAVNANVLLNGFVWDDSVQILSNPWIRDATRLGEVFRTHLVGFNPDLSTSFYRPLVHVVYAGVYGAAELTPWAYHIVNLALHAAASAVVLIIAARFAPMLPATVAALIFATHPVHAEAVAWAAGIYDVAYAVAALISIALITSEQPTARRWATLPFAIALLWKEPAVAVLPIAIAWLGSRGELRTRWREVAALGLVLALYLIARIAALGGLAGTDHNPVRLTGPQARLTFFAVVWEYASILVLPLRLSAVHEVNIPVSFFDARVLLGSALVVAFSIMFWRARRQSAILLGLAMLAFPLLPSLYTPALRDSLYAERYVYLPSAGACVLLSLALRHVPPRWLVPVSAVVVLVLSMASIRRNLVWRSDITLWTDATEKAPGNVYTWEALGGAYAVQRRYDEAIPYLFRAVSMSPGRSDAETNLALCLGSVGRPAEAWPHVMAALRSCPNCTTAREVAAWLSGQIAE